MNKKQNGNTPNNSSSAQQHRAGGSGGGKRRRSNRKRPNNRERLQESFDMTKSGDVTPDQRRLERSLADNDPAWYAQNPQLLKDYASYPFGYPLGGQISGQNSVYTSAIPGVMAISFAPTVGVANSETSPINVAMRKLYSFVRYANSGAKNYDAPDLMLYVVAVDSARMYLEWMKRIYGVMMNYTAFNRYYPRALVEGMRGNFADLESNLADFRGYINQFAVKLNQLWVPRGFSYFSRHEWLCQHIYVDSNTSAKAQTYFFTPAYFYQFTVAGTPAAGSLVSKPLTSTINATMSLSDMVNFGNALLNPLITNEDIGIMAGDILKAYGAGGVLQTTGISEDYRVLPEYSPEVQSQLENLMFADINNPSFLNVTQNTAIGGGFLQSKPMVRIIGNKFGTPGDPVAAGKQPLAQAMLAPLAGARFLNMHTPSPRPEDVIVATRGMFTIDNSSVQYVAAFMVTANVNACGSEIFTQTNIYTTAADGTLSVNSLRASADWSVANAAQADNVAAAATTMAQNFTALEQFDWHPNVNIGLISGAPEDYAWSYSKLPFVDSDNYTFVDEQNIANMHALALLSEFTVPMVS